MSGTGRRTRNPRQSRDYDVVLVGGGLANCCILLALAASHPKLRVALVERESSLVKNHTYCFHEGDLSARSLQWLRPAIEKVWPGYEVKFFDRNRWVDLAYGAITSDRLDQLVQGTCAKLPGFDLFLNQAATASGPKAVEVSQGPTLRAPWIVQAKGPGSFGARAGDPSSPAGSRDRPTLYQKFVGLELSLERPTERQVPLLMDATLPQLGSFHFMYLLPLEERRVLLEDTFFSEHADLDVSACRHRILAYAREQGFQVREVLREEVGVLPMPCEGRAFVIGDAPLKLGYQGGWFHPTTGYSLPIAARVAEVFSLPMTSWRVALERLCHRHARDFRFAAFLNRLLLLGFAPENRWNVFSRFYGFDESMIARFYAFKPSAIDRARILCGKPPKEISLHQLWSGVTS